MTGRTEVPPPQEVIDELLKVAGPSLVMVGGQALAFWMARYQLVHDVPDLGGSITRDVDFLARSPTDHEAVKRLALTLGGQVVIPDRNQLTALVGQAIRQVDENNVWNVDVIFRLIGNDARSIFAEAAETDLGEGWTLNVMNPLHVLKSRLDNLYVLRDKQNSLGEAQLRCAIEVVQRFQRELANAGDTAAIKRTVREVARWALRTDAGKKIARRRGIHVADAIEANLIQCLNFRSLHLPRLLPAMSLRRRSELEI